MLQTRVVGYVTVTLTLPKNYIFQGHLKVIWVSFRLRNLFPMDLKNKQKIVRVFSFVTPFGVLDYREYPCLSFSDALPPPVKRVLHTKSFSQQALKMSTIYTLTMCYAIIKFGYCISNKFRFDACNFVTDSLAKICYFSLFCLIDSTFYVISKKVIKRRQIRSTRRKFDFTSSPNASVQKSRI